MGKRRSIRGNNRKIPVMRIIAPKWMRKKASLEEWPFATSLP
jgi:hypothetical protein